MTQLKKNALIKKYMPIVYALVGTAIRNSNLSYDELVSEGYMMLVRCIGNGLYDKNKKTTLSTYLWIRIRGRMIDAKREYDPFPRYGRRDYVDIPKGQYRREYRRLYNQEKFVHIRLDYSGNGVLQDQNDPTALHNCIPDKTKGVETLVLENERSKILLEAIGELSEKYKSVMLHYYYDEMTLQQIGEILNVSESRACQIKTKALKKLRHRLDRNELMCA